MLQSKGRVDSKLMLHKQKSQNASLRKRSLGDSIKTLVGSSVGAIVATMNNSKRQHNDSGRKSLPALHLYFALQHHRAATSGANKLSHGKMEDTEIPHLNPRQQPSEGGSPEGHQGADAEGEAVVEQGGVAARR